MAVDLLQRRQGRHAFGKAQPRLNDQRWPQVPGHPDTEKAHREHPRHQRQAVQLLAGEQRVGRNRRHQPARYDRRTRRSGGLVDVAFQQRPARATESDGHALPKGEANQQRDDRHIERPADFEARVNIRRCQQCTQKQPGQESAQGQLTRRRGRSGSNHASTLAAPIGAKTRALPGGSRAIRPCCARTGQIMPVCHLPAELRCKVLVV